MKIFLVGRHKDNDGPSNVNRELINCSDDDLMYIQNWSSKTSVLLEFIKKYRKSDIVIWSCINPLYYIFLKMFKKKSIHLMHGCLDYENKINKLGAKKIVTKSEKKALDTVDCIVCVSKWYSEWVGNRYPDLKDKIVYINNGVRVSKRPKQEKKPYSIAVTGGDRAIKNNYEVCKAVENLVNNGFPCVVYVFGVTKMRTHDLSKFPFVKIMGQMDKKEYYDNLDTISLMVMNSECEPFGLSAIDGLNCNCSLLMSVNVGAKSIMSTLESDIIKNPHDIKELQDKIKNTLLNGNSDRLVSSIDSEKVSSNSSYKALKKICYSLK